MAAVNHQDFGLHLPSGLWNIILLHAEDHCVPQNHHGHNIELPATEDKRNSVAEDFASWLSLNHAEFKKVLGDIDGYHIGD